MGNDIGDILSRKKIPSEPAEFAVIREFVKEKFQVMPELKLHNEAIVIGLTGSALAGSLRLCLPELEERLKTSRRLIVSSV
jgi:hypothetical protein